MITFFLTHILVTLFVMALLAITLAGISLWRQHRGGAR